MKTVRTKAEDVICELIVQLANDVAEVSIATRAATKLAQRGKAIPALRMLMEAESAAHAAVENFRACMTVRTTLLPDESQPRR